MSILGTRVIRTEDPRLLTVGGSYVDDLRVPELADAARITFVRSPVAHALISGLDVAAAREAPGVVAVLTAQDMDDLAPPPPPDAGAEVPEGAPLPLGGLWGEPLLAIGRALRFARSVLEASGAKRIFQTQVLSTHVQGSCRMGSDPGRSAVDPPPGGRTASSPTG